jgi:hypothetical protein
MWPLSNKPLPNPPGADDLNNAQQPIQASPANSGAKRQVPDRVPTPFPLTEGPPEFRHLRFSPEASNLSTSMGYLTHTPTRAGGGEVNRPLALATPEPASRQDSPASVRTVWPRFDPASVPSRRSR